MTTAPPPPTPLNPPAPAEPERTPLVLVVDDDEAARYAKMRVITRAGFRAIEAATGTTALEQAREKAPDLILLDVKLPDISGLEVCRRLRADPHTASGAVLQ